MKRLYGFLSLCCVVALASSLQADGSLFESARKEGKLLLYNSMLGPEALELAGAFEKRFPGVKVETFRGDSERLLTRILAEQRAGKNAVDVVELNGDVMQVLSQKALLTKFIHPEKQAYGNRFTDPDGYWVPFRLLVQVIVYNTKIVSTQDVPRRYSDLLNSRWKGRRIGINTAKPQFAYTMIDLYGKEKGTEFLKKLAAQDPLTRNGATLITQLVAAGEFPLGFPMNSSAVDRTKSIGAPVDWARLEEPLYADLKTIGIMAKASHPNAARLFLTFLASKEGQSITAEMGYVVVRKDVDLKVPLDLSRVRLVPPSEGAKLQYYIRLVSEIFGKSS